MKAEWTDSYKGFSIFDVAQFGNLEKDQVARICLIDTELDMALAHWLTIADGDKRNGYYKCLGNYATIMGAEGKQGKGADPENCPSCARQMRNSPVGLVARRFACNMMRYLTDNKGSVRQPLMADCLAWRFGEDKFGRILDIKTQFADPTHGLRVLDLMIRCNNKQYQKYDIDPLRECLWRTQGQVFANQFVEIWKQNRQPNLDELLGNSIDKIGMERLVAEALGVGAIAPANGSAGMQAPMANPADLQRLLDDSRPAVAVPGSSFSPPQQPVPGPVLQMPGPGPMRPPDLSGPPAQFVTSDPRFQTQPAGPVAVAEPPRQVTNGGLMPPPLLQTTGPIPPPPLQNNPIAPPPPVQSTQQAPTMPPAASFDDLLKL